MLGPCLTPCASATPAVRALCVSSMLLTSADPLSIPSLIPSASVSMASTMVREAAGWAMDRVSCTPARLASKC